MSRTMRYLSAIVFFISLFITSGFAQADAFSDNVDLSAFRKITVQDRQTLKTFDTFARQTLDTITGKSSLDGQDAVYTVLDMACRPELYESRNIIKIKNVPLRQDFQRLTSLSMAERDRILREGTISLKFWASPEVAELVSQLQSSAIFKAKAIQEVNQAAGTLQNLTNSFPAITIIPPAPTDSANTIWHGFGELVGNVGGLDSHAQEGHTPPPPLPGYDNQLVGESFMRIISMMVLWQKQDATGVNEQLGHIAELLPTINPAVYPSSLNRTVEIVYNKLAKLTIPGAFIYFAAFVCFLVSARSGVNSVRLWGLRLFLLAFLVHTLGIAVRWWLVATQHGNWFDGIPIKNQFESVLMSAWFGAAIGLILEIRRSRAVFGAAASFVGWLSLIAIFTVPQVTGTQIGGEIGQVSGVLMSYWLYLHVTMVVAAYAMIAMGFGLSVWWLISYYRNYGTLAKTPVRQLSSDLADLDSLPTMGTGGGAISLGWTQTLAMMLFIPTRRAAVKDQSHAATSMVVPAEGAANAKFLATLDACNLVVLQLAFWVLGTGIILGAIWADQSWGRPWGWDPKETFALVTWIVYLVVVHVRVATVNKAWWTAVLSILGFFIMLFNWIGVNFFLVGLHSYA
jgi:cytochrome c-type biogenesis protein CcsB